MLGGTAVKNPTCELGKPRPGVWARGVSCAAAVVAMLGAALLIPMFFGSNDDAYVAQILSGRGGAAAEPTPYISFINYALCRAFTWFYSIIPMVPWWTVFHLAAIFAALSAIGHALLVEACDRLAGRRVKPWMIALALCAADFGIAAYFVGRLQFTFTASLLMAAAIVVACIGCGEKACGSRRRSLVAPAIMGAIGFALRSDSGYLGFFFWALAVGALLAKARGSLRERIVSVCGALVPLLCAGAVALVLLVVDGVAYSPQSLSESLRMDSALAVYTGYPRTRYAEDPSRYEAVGWDEGLSELAGDWFMMDERVNADSMSTLNEQNTAAIDDLVEDPVGTVYARLVALTQPVPLAYLVLLLSMSVTAFALSPSHAERAIVWAICLSVVAFLGYLLVRGRLLERAAYAVTIPATAALFTIAAGDLASAATSGRSICSPAIASTLGIVCLAPLFRGATNAGRLACLLGVLFCVAIVAWAVMACRQRKPRLPWMRAAIVLLAVIVTIAPGVIAVKKIGLGSEGAKQQEQLLANTNAFFDYVRKHPDTLYIDSGCAITMQNVWQDEWPVNQTGWGGWRFPYDYFDEAMRAAGFDGRPTSGDFLSGETMLVADDEETCNLLIRYMRNTFGDDVEMQLVDSITDAIKVYEFVRTEA